MPPTINSYLLNDAYIYIYIYIYIYMRVCVCVVRKVCAIFILEHLKGNLFFSD